MNMIFDDSWNSVKFAKLGFQIKADNVWLGLSKQAYESSYDQFENQPKLSS